MLPVWRSGDGINCINEVTLRQTQLVLRLVTIRWYTVLACHQPLGPTQPPILRRMGNKYSERTLAVLFSWEGNPRSCIMRCRLCGVVNYRLSGLRKGDEQPPCAAGGVWHPLPLPMSSLKCY